MANQNLDNLVKIGQLESDPFEEIEAMRILNLAHNRLLDSEITGLSIGGRFMCTYNAAHGAALAALRWHGFRCENELMAFHCLGDTLAWPENKWRVFDSAHQKRNLVEYEGYLAIEESTIEELRDLTATLIKDVEKLVKLHEKLFPHLSGAGEKMSKQKDTYSPVPHTRGDDEKLFANPEFKKAWDELEDQYATLSK